MAKSLSFLKAEQSMREFSNDFGLLDITAGSGPRHQGPKRSVKNPKLFDISATLSGDGVYKLTPLSQHSLEYSRITNMITNKRNFKVDNIEKIENPYLETAYELKKLEKKSKYSLNEVLLFHGTKKVHVDGICKMNFNWRHCQAHKYGRGVSFSQNATYASNYSDQNVHNKVMIVAKVLIGKSCIGNKNMNIPPDGYDTSTKNITDHIVVVKYEDNDFRPLYKISYHVIDENVGKRKKDKKGDNTPVYHDFDDYDDVQDDFSYWEDDLYDTHQDYSDYLEDDYNDTQDYSNYLEDDYNDTQDYSDYLEDDYNNTQDDYDYMDYFY